MPLTQRITVEELCAKLKPVFGKRMDELYLKYAMAESEEERREIEHILNALYHKNLAELLDKKVLLEPPSKEIMDGEYPLAIISYADKKLYPFALREQDWIRHLCISGMSGSGKTTLAFHVIGNFIKKEKPFLIFDWKKSFRPLMLVDSEIWCFTVGNENISNLFRTNINQPPEGVSAKEWINVLCDLVTESFFASYGVHKILLETLDEAFKDFGVYSGSKNYPTWNEIKWRLESRLEKTKGRTATWLESALRIAHVLTFGNFGKVLNYKGKESLTTEDLFNKKIIFELNSLGTIEKKFFCEFILTYIYKFKKANQAKLNEIFDHAILVDEAHNIFLKEKTHFVKESVTDMIYREMREYGTALICLDQHISKISDTVVGNSACHVAFQQQLPQDIETISELMQLKERKQYFSMLPVGSAIVKLAERYAQPFLVEVPEVKLRRQEVADVDVKNRMKFIFEGRALEQGKDPEFAKDLMHPETALEEKETKEEEIAETELIEEPELVIREEVKEARVPNHSLFNGEIEKFKELDTAIRKDYSFKSLEQLQEIPREITIDDGREYGKKEKIEDETEEKIEEAAKEKATEQKIETKDLIAENKDAVRKELIKEVETNIDLNEVQKILYEYVEKKLAKGWNTRQIERILEEHAIEGNYSIVDVFAVVNYALKNQFKVAQSIPKDVTTVEKLKVYKEQNNSLSNPKGNLDNEEEYNELSLNDGEKFLIFLRENSAHKHSTTELYKKLGLSARKGNKIKNELIDKGKIKIEEIKNNKGWKKVIRLNL